MARTSKLVQQADVVVIGGGAAGLPAAVTAKEAGAENVYLIEQRLNVGGNASRAEGIFAAESPTQKRALIYASCDDIYTKMMKWHHFSRIDPRIFRAYLKKSGETVGWLEGKGIVFRVGTSTRFRFDQNPVWHIPEGKCASIVKALSKDLKELGINVLTRTRAKNLVIDGRGRVKGVIVQNQKQTLEFKAKSIIISTGGFSGSKTLLKKYFTYYQDNFFAAGLALTGDGIKLAAEAGAAIEDYACLMKETGFGVSPLTFSLNREPYLVCVNRKGERFIGEDSLSDYPMECGNVVIRQPGREFFALFDDSIARTIEKEGFIMGRPGVHMGDPGIPIPGFREELRSDRYRRGAKVSSSLDEIADWIGAKQNILKATVEEYNACCHRGYDASFVKERRFLKPLNTPPYYAIRFFPMITDTVGPIRINERMEILNEQDEAIPGLYAAGVIASGWTSEEYSSEICGSAMGFSLNSGRIAAENAVRYASRQRK